MRSVIPRGRGCGAAMSGALRRSRPSNSEIESPEPGRGAAAVAAAAAAAPTNDCRSLARSLLHLPALNQRQRERQTRLQNSAMHRSLLSTSSLSTVHRPTAAAAAAAGKSLFHFHRTHAASAPVLPALFLVPMLPVLSCPVLCLQPILSPSALLSLGPSAPIPSPAVLADGMPCLCNPPPPGPVPVPAPSACPVCQFGDACLLPLSFVSWGQFTVALPTIALKTPLLATCPYLRVLKCDLGKGIKSYCIVRAYYRIPGT